MKRFEGAISLLALSTGLFLALVPGPASATTYGGRSTGCILDAPPQPPMSACDTGELPSGGGNLSDVVPNASLSGNGQVVVAANLSCTASASGTVSQCTSQAENVALELTELLLTTTLTATSVGCVAIATCEGLSGSSTISGLAIAGVSVAVTGEANQTVSIPGIATLVINEQIQTSTEITVNALHLTLLNATEIIVGSARASIDDCGTLPVEASTWGKVKALYR